MELETWEYIELEISIRNLHRNLALEIYIGIWHWIWILENGNSIENIGKWEHWLQAMQILDSVGCYIDCKIVFDIYNGSP